MRLEPLRLIGVDRPDGSHVAMAQNSPALSFDEHHIQRQNADDRCLGRSSGVMAQSSKDQKIFDEHVAEFFSSAYKSFKPIGIATSGAPHVALSDASNPVGVVMADDDLADPRLLSSLVGGVSFTKLHGVF